MQVFAQQEDRFRLYTAGDGLSNSSITGIAQDTNGYIWVGTQRGLNRYDGKQFVQFHTGNDNHSLPDETITHLVWLDNYRLAAYTPMGLHIVNTGTGETKDIIIPATDAKYLYKFNLVMGALSDPAGDIYILGRSGFYHYNKDYKLIYRFDYYTKEQTLTEHFLFGDFLYRLSDTELLLIAIDGGYIYNTQTRRLNKITAAHAVLSELGIWPHGTYQVCQPTPGTLLLIKEKTNAIIYIDYKQRRKIVSATDMPDLIYEFNWRSNLSRVNDSLFYFTSRQKGFFKLHINAGTGKVILDTTRYFPGHLCTGFVTGNDNRLWIATTVGLLKETNRQPLAQQIIVPAAVLQQTPDLRIRQLFCYKNLLYVGCLGSGGLLVFDKITGRFLYKVSFEKYHLPVDVIYSIIGARNDSLLIANNRLFWLKAGTHNPVEAPLPGWDTAHNWISYLFKDSRGKIWATSNDNGKTYVLTSGAREFKRIDYSESVYKEVLVPNYICEDLQGNIWMCCHGICRINSASGRPDLYMDSFPYIRIPQRELTSMYIDKNNILWAGIKNNGLAGYDINKGTFRYYTTNEGLPDNLIKSVYPLRNTVWVTTASGMASLNTLTGKIARFGKHDGFPVLPVTTSDLFYDTAAHYLYCGFTDRIVRFNPDSLSYTEQPPSFFIESVHFFNDTTYYHPHGAITIPYYKNDITVTLGTINYNDVSNQLIAYRLAGSKDSTWIPLSGDIINFNNLSPGTYRLQVQLSAANNRWQPQQREIDIVITVPFWKTLWFTVLVIGVVLTLIWFIYRQNINIIRRTERAKVQVQELKAKQIESERVLILKRQELASINEQLAEAQLTALQAQMNPHFIFNALNSIKRMVLDNETRNASRYLSRFAQMIRLTLNHSKETFVTLQETIEYLHAYLEMEQLRFGSSFSYIIQTTGITDEEEINIPTLMIQPLVENAIWHGLMPKNGDKKITIQFEQAMDMVTCTIGDNGIGIGESEKIKRTNKQPSVGLGNLRNRIKIMNEKHNMNCTLAITDLSKGNGNETGTRVVLQFKILL